MSDVSVDRSYFGADVRLHADGVAPGLVSFGGVAVSPEEAAEFVMIHRTQVLKESGAVRTDMAQRRLDLTKRARQFKNDLQDLKAWVDTGKSWKDRIPVTPEMISFMKNDVGAHPGTQDTRILFWGSAVAKLPQSVLDHYDFKMDANGNWDPHAPGKFAIEKNDDGHNRWEMHGVTVIDKETRDNMSEELDNFIDLQNDRNTLANSQMKTAVNLLSESTDAATGLGDKNHELWKTLFSSFDGR